MPLPTGKQRNNSLGMRRANAVDLSFPPPLELGHRTARKERM